VLFGVFEIFFVSNVSAEVTTTDVRVFFVDTFTTITPDASPATC
jgi:hypothetical protein